MLRGGREGTVVDGPGILARRANFSRIKDPQLSYRFLSPRHTYACERRIIRTPAVSSAEINSPLCVSLLRNFILDASHSLRSTRVETSQDNEKEKRNVSEEKRNANLDWLTTRKSRETNLTSGKIRASVPRYTERR